MRITRSITTLVAAVALVFGATAASAGETPAPSTTEYSASADVQAEPLVLGAWTYYEGNFKTKFTCEARKLSVLNSYGHKVYGGIGKAQCVETSIPACPKPITQIVLNVRYWGYKNGPSALPDTASQEFATATPDAVAAAC